MTEQELLMGSLQLLIVVGMAYLTVTVLHITVKWIVNAVKEVFKC